MKSIILLLILGILIQKISYSQIPVIQFQPNIVNICKGDSVTLEVITDNIYEYQWFSAKTIAPDYNSLEEITGENSSSLTLDPVLCSSDSSLYFFLRVVNLDDTIWSEVISVHIKVIGKAISDTVFVNAKTYLIPIPVQARIPLKTLIWSNCDTTSYFSGESYVVFDQLGQQWVITQDQGCTRIDTFTVAIRPKSLHVTYAGTSHQTWNADTVYIENNVALNQGLTILPGTVIKFSGNYMITADYIEADGYDRDSIYIIGSNNSPIFREGKITASKPYVGIREKGNILRNISFRNLRNIHVSYPVNSEFRENDSLELWSPDGCTIYRNNFIELYRSLSDCILSGNDTIYGIASSKRYGHNVFGCYHNLFKSNNSGLIVKGGELSEIGISMNFFIQNKSTAIKASLPARVFIDENIFYENISYSSASIFTILNFIYPTQSLYSHPQFYIRNNTIHNNQGNTTVEIVSPDTLQLLFVNMVNNIFNDSNDETVRIESYSPLWHENGIISCNSFRRTKQESLRLDTSTFSISGNLFNMEPEFENPEHLLLTLKENSPLIDAGNDTVLISDRGLTIDFNKLPRKIGNSVDIGAYEYFLTPLNSFSYITPDTTICYDEKNFLKVSPSFETGGQNLKISWYRNGKLLPDSLQGKSNLNLSSVTVPSGYYYVCITGLQDTIWSKPIVVVSERKPIIYEQPVSEQVCKGMDAIFEVGAGNNSNTSYSWFSSNGGKLPSDSSICYLSTVTEIDSIFAIASNTCGSTYSDTVNLTLFPVFEPSLGNDTALYVGDSMLIDPNIDFKFYKWSNGSIAQHIYAYPGDTIWLEVTDSNNCIGRDTMIIYSLPVANIISARSGVRFIVFPNPAKDKLYINLADQTPYTIKILSLDGKLVYETITRKEQYLTIDVSGLVKGTYIIFLHSDFTNELLKLILQ